MTMKHARTERTLPLWFECSPSQLFGICNASQLLLLHALGRWGHENSPRSLNRQTDILAFFLPSSERHIGPEVSGSFLFQTCETFLTIVSVILFPFVPLARIVLKLSTLTEHNPNNKHVCRTSVAISISTFSTLRDKRDCVRGSRKQNGSFYSFYPFVRSRMRVSTFVTVVA
jgi:hypothetical protein